MRQRSPPPPPPPAPVGYAPSRTTAILLDLVLAAVCIILTVLSAIIVVGLFAR